jgi:hypothetical protein
MVMAMRVMFSSMLFEPFAGAEIEDGGGEEDDGCDGEDCVVHKKRMEQACLGSGQRGIRISLARRRCEVRKQLGKEITTGSADSNSC